MPYAILFYRLVVRPLRGEPVRTLLTALAVALGVAVVLAIEMAGQGGRRIVPVFLRDSRR